MPEPPRPTNSSAHSVPPPLGHVPRRSSPASRGATGERPGNPSLHVLCGAIAVIWGAGILISKLFGVGGWDVHGNAAFEFGKDVGVLGGAALIVAGVFHVHRGARRYKGVEVPDVTRHDRVRNIGISIVIGLITLAVAPAVPDPDGRFDDPRAPYSYDFPGSWTQNDAEEIRATYRWMSELSGVARSDHNAGVTVSTALPGDADAWVNYFTAQVSQQGGQTVERRAVTIAGLPGTTAAYDMPEGRHDGSWTVLRGANRRFLIWCQWESNPAAAQEGCDMVRNTLRVKQQDAARGTAAPAA